MDVLHRWSSLLAVIIGLCLFLLLVVMPASAADNTEPDCSYDSIRASFVAGYPEAVGKSEPKIKEIQALLKKAKYDPGKLDGFLGSDTYKALNQFCASSKDEVRSMQLEQNKKARSPNDLANILVEILTKITDWPPDLQKLVTHVDDQTKEIMLSGGGCGCSRDFKEHAQVYGFYPYWLADGKEHIVDFSLFDRIGYFALTLNEQGYITHNLHFPTDATSDPNIARFIKQAHIHRVKVDVTFVASSWQSWKGNEINNAVRNIVETVTREYEIEEPRLWRKHLPFVENYSTAKADGINLYFDRYDDPAQGERLIKIVKEVKEKLKLANSDARLNIMLGFNLAKLDRGVLSVTKQTDQKLGEEYKELAGEFRELEKRFKAIEEILAINKDMVDNVLIFLSRNTRRSKKDLRQLIENAFIGEARQTVMRKMLPIAPVQGLALPKTADGEPKPDEKDGQLNDDKASEEKDGQLNDDMASEDKDNQFDDDLIYMQDNFAGIGLWHLPLLDKPKAKESGGQKDGSKPDKVGKDSKKIASPEKTAKTEVENNLAKAKASVDDEIALQEAANTEVVNKTEELEKAKGEAKKFGIDTETENRSNGQPENGDNTGAENNDVKAAQEALAAAEKKLADLDASVSSLDVNKEIAKKKIKEKADKLELAKDKAAKEQKEIDDAMEALEMAGKALDVAKEDVATANAAVKKAKEVLVTVIKAKKETATGEQTVGEGVAVDESAEDKVVAGQKAIQDDVEILREALEFHFQLKSDFQPGGQFAFLGEKFEDVRFKLCEWACPNRWVFRIAIDVLIVLALLYWLWALVDCRLREFYQRRFLWFTGYGVMIAMVFAVSAACDPSLKNNALKVMFGVSLLIPVSWGISRIRKMNQPLLP